MTAHLTNIIMMTEAMNIKQNTNIVKSPSQYVIYNSHTKMKGRITNVHCEIVVLYSF